MREGFLDTCDEMMEGERQWGGWGTWLNDGNLSENPWDFTLIPCWAQVWNIGGKQDKGMGCKKEACLSFFYF